MKTGIAASIPGIKLVIIDYCNKDARSRRRYRQVLNLSCCDNVCICKIAPPLHFTTFAEAPSIYLACACEFV